jgi:hypothetical protein
MGPYLLDMPNGKERLGNVFCMLVICGVLIYEVDL